MPRPRLDDGVDVERVDVLGEFDQVDRGGVDRKIDDHAAPRPRRQERGQHVAIVLLGDRGMDEAQLALIEQAAIRVLRRDDHELVAVEADVPLDQRQRSLADRAEADHHDRAVEARVQGRGVDDGVGHMGHGVHIRCSSWSANDKGRSTILLENRLPPPDQVRGEAFSGSCSMRRAAQRLRRARGWR